jgi:hypothetical protein
VTATRHQRTPAPAVPWARFVRAADCACTYDAPCLFHYALDLDWRDRTAACARAGIDPSTGR